MELQDADASFAFCGRIGSACVDLLNRVFNAHLIGFLLRATKQEQKSALKILRYCLSRRPRKCILQLSGNTLQWAETFKDIGVVFTNDGSRNKEIETQIIGKTNAVLCELDCSVMTKRELSKNAKFSVFKSVFVPVLTYGQQS